MLKSHAECERGLFQGVLAAFLTALYTCILAPFLQVPTAPKGVIPGPDTE
jgi:hypothetical protein